MADKLIENIRIGLISFAYTSRRNFIGATSAKYVNVRWLYRFTLRYWLNKLFPKRFPMDNAFKSPFLGKYFYDVMHFFNTISYDKHPWITTGGGLVPWFGKEMQEYLYADMDITAVVDKKKMERGIAACASPYCKAIIVNSKHSLWMENEMLNEFPIYAEAIRKKMHMIYPPQKLIVQSVEEKKKYTQHNSKLIFMFVGVDYFRKGGLACLRAFERLSKKYSNFTFISIGSLRNDVPDVFDKKMEIEARDLINKYNGTWLTHYDSLDNDKVIQLMKIANVGLLPTYSDIFGYSVLEFQACGCPVITTDVRALTEINPPECGWVFSIGKKTKHKEIQNMKEVMVTQELENKLEECIKNILDKGCVEDSMIQNCLQRVIRYHSPNEHKKQLTDLYINAVR